MLPHTALNALTLWSIENHVQNPNMNFYEKFKLTSERWNCFSKSDLLGSFDFMTLTISLESLNINDFNRLSELSIKDNYKKSLKDRNLSFELYEILSKLYGLAFHEYTHFIDTTSTVWGVYYLKHLNDAYMTNYDAFGIRESEYYKAKLFYDLAKSLKLPDYYTAITSNIDYSRPWSYHVSAGKRFDSNGYITSIPIPFISFLNKNRERIVRSPLSMIAILEVSAMAQEFLYKTFLVNVLPEDIRLVEGIRLKNESLDFIYNHSLTEYTACAHLVANLHGFKDILQAYMVCERISTTVLNFTDDTFDKIVFSSSAKKILQIDKNIILADVAYNAIKCKDRGYIFYIICLLMPHNTYHADDIIIHGITAALSEMGIEYNKIFVDAKKEIAKISEILKRSPFKGLSILASSFVKNFEGKINSKDGRYNFSSFDLPPVLLGDCEIIPITFGDKNSLAKFDLESSYNELVKGQLWVEKFSEACF